MRIDLDKILLNVQKPLRYTGNELNAVNKSREGSRVEVAVCFPDIYEIGMSHLGLRILYDIINQMEGIRCERAFAPWTDMEAVMAENGIPLFSLESAQPLSEFDLLGFTLQYELSYTNVLHMLKLAGIPLLSARRASKDPLIIAGGPCAFNPEPMADFIDFFVLGDGEEAIREVLTMYDRHKSKGGDRRGFLDAVYDVKGVYVPSKPKKKVTKRIVRDLDKTDFPVRAIVPHMQIVHDRAMIELFRGCSRGCRFCQAGYVYRPVRERTPETLADQAYRIIDATGYEEISLNSLSTGDYSDIGNLTNALMPLVNEKRVNLSLPSMRVDSLTLELLKSVQNDRKSGLTFAPEAGTDRLRRVINKGITEEEILDSAGLAFGEGYRKIKLYFMLGLPTETMDDVEGIALLVEKIAGRYAAAKGSKRGLSISVSTAFFVPKPFTPFQWEPQEEMAGYLRKTGYLKKRFDRRYVDYSWHDPQTGFLEALLARGDRSTGRTILKAYSMGCRFDAWREHFDFQKWMKACEAEGTDPGYHVTRKRSDEEELPWDHIDIGITKEFFISERDKAFRGSETAGCREGCANCGLLGLRIGACAK